MADAVTSGNLLHKSYCAGVRSGYVLHTVFGSRFGSAGISRPKMSFPVVLQ